MSINAHTKTFPCACTDLGIPKVGKVKEKEELKIMFIWGKFLFDVILDRGIFTYLKNKKLLIWIVNREFNIFIFQLEQYTIL